MTAETVEVFDSSQSVHLDSRVIVPRQGLSGVEHARQRLDQVFRRQLWVSVGLRNFHRRATAVIGRSFDPAKVKTEPSTESVTGTLQCIVEENR